MFAIPKSDALDVLLFGIGLRITQLAKMGDPKFKSLLDNRNFTIQMGSEAQDIYRTFSVENGRFNQKEGKTDKPTLSIDFKDSMTGAKLLTKGDATAFMMGIQNGEVKMSGDYSLLMWFNQVAKFIVPKIPEHLQPAVDAAKPFITKATPMAKELCDKGMALLAGFGLFGASTAKAKADDKNEKAEKSDKVKDTAEKDVDTKDDGKSLVDTAKEKLADVKAEVEEKVGELKEKFDEVKDDAKEKFDEVKAKAEDKVEEVKSDAQEKLDTAKEKAEALKSDVKEKADDLKKDVTEKVEEVKDEAKNKLDTAKEKMDDVKEKAEEKVSDIKDKADEKAETVKDKAEDLKKEVTDKAETAKDKIEEKADKAVDSTQAKLDELKAKAEADKTESLTPAQKASHELEEKHAGEKVIAENVKIDAVKDDKSPVTEVMVTRASDKK